MTYEERQKWLESLQVGDEVCYHSQWRGRIITKIAKITPTRQIKTEDGRTFREGYNRVDKWNVYLLQPVTDEARNAKRRNLLYTVITKTKLDTLTTDQLERIYAIIREETP